MTHDSPFPEKRVTKAYETPGNLVDLLDGVVHAAARTAFYSPRLSGRSGVRDLADFAAVPVTPLETYRKQRLRDVLAEPGEIEWIVGQYKGQSAASVAVAEGAREGANRYDLFTDAVKECIALETARTCAVIASSEKRYFGAEIATILIRAGVPSHLFVDSGDERTYERLHQTSPDILVVLWDQLAEAELPRSIELCVTFRRSHAIERFRQLDVYLVDELGFLGHSTDGRSYRLNKDIYWFERSDVGNLIVTSLYGHVQPALRLETMDRVESIGPDGLELAEPSRFG